jgi:hypothetical protein
MHLSKTFPIILWKKLTKKFENKFIELNFLSKNVAYESYIDYPIHTILWIEDWIKMLFSCLILIYYMSLLIFIFQCLK